MYPSPGQSVKSSRYGVQPIAMPISFRPPSATRKRPTQKIKKQMPAAAPCSAAFASGIMCLLQGVFQNRLRSAGRGKRNWCCGLSYSALWAGLPCGVLAVRLPGFPTTARCRNWRRIGWLHSIASLDMEVRPVPELAWAGCLA